MKKLSILLITVILASLCLCSCSEKKKTITLNVYNWGEYISDGSDDTYNTNGEFEKYFNTYLSEKYGGVKVKVNYSTFASNEDMFAKRKGKKGK